MDFIALTEPKKRKEKKPRTDGGALRINVGVNRIMQQGQRACQKGTQGSAAEEIRHHGQAQLVEEAGEFGRIQQIRGAVGATGDVAKVDAGEGVDGARVAADRHGFGHGLSDLDEIESKGLRGVLVDRAEWAAVPVVGDSLVARLPR